MPSSFRKARKSLSLSKLSRPFKRSSVRLRSSRSSSSNSSGSSNSGGPPSVVYPTNTSINFNDDDKVNEEKSVLVSPIGSANNVVEEVDDDVDNHSSSDSSYVAIGRVDNNKSDCIATTEVDDIPDIIIPTEETDSLVIVNNVENIPAIDTSSATNIVEEEDTPKQSANRISHDNENKPPNNDCFNIGTKVRVVKKGHKRYGMCGVIVKETKCYVYFEDERSKEIIKIYRTSLACVSQEDITSSPTATADDEKESSPLIPPQSKESSMISQKHKSNNTNNLQVSSDKPTDFSINSSVTVISTHSLHGGKTGTVIRHTAKYVVVIFKESSKERRISPKFLVACYTDLRETASLSTTSSNSEPNSSISTRSQSCSKNTVEAWIPSHSKQSSMISQKNKSNNAHNLQSLPFDNPTDFAINSCVSVISTHSLHGGKTGTVIRHTAKFVVVIFKELPQKESRISPKFLVACK